MEGRVARYRQLSPERAKVWTEKSAKCVQNRKVPVVYYLCRNRQLEHPHFIEVDVSSGEGLYLRDVIGKLNALRGKGMASMYSWSCKRSYKNGFVWHDLCEDDLVIPARGSEYVLKGSEIIEESNSGGHSPSANYKFQNTKQLPEPPSSGSQDDAPCSSSMIAEGVKHHQEDEVSPSSWDSASPVVSVDSRLGNSSSWVGSVSLIEHKASNNEGAADASTQTEESTEKPKLKEACTCGPCGVSTSDVSIESECTHHEVPRHIKQVSQTYASSLSPFSSASASSPGRKAATLGSLIRNDASRINSFRILEGEDVKTPTNPKLRAPNVLMQLISCGSISVKDHRFGLVPTYRPQFSHLNFPSPIYSTSVVLGELDCLPEKGRLTGRRLEDKAYFSGSLVETKIFKEGGTRIPLKRSSSFNADRSSRQVGFIADKETTSARHGCSPLFISKTSFDGLDGQYDIAGDAPDGNSKRITTGNEKIMKTEESWLRERGS